MTLLAPAAALAAGSGEELSSQFLPLSAVRKGMQATVRTQLQGDQIVDVPAEIIGVLKSALGPGQSLILARLEGERVKETGVAAGMSGSPVYVDGKLVGALSYSMGPFTKDAIAGVTPIEYMLELTHLPQARGPHGGGPAGAAGTTGGPLPGENAAFLSGEKAPSPATGSALAADPLGVGLRPIETPLVVTGVPAGILAGFERQFKALGVEAVAGVAGNATGETAMDSSPIRPGDAITAELVGGDISIGATGTVTYVDGDRVLAFGHPFLFSGPVQFPMARAEVLWTLANLQQSQKIVQVGPMVGTWEQIRLPGISGVTSHVPSMIPMTVKVDTPGRTATYKYEVAKHRDWSPLLAAVSLSSSLANTPAFTDESTFFVKGRFGIKGHDDVVMENLYTGFGGRNTAALATAGDVQAIFSAVFQNRFEDPDVTSIDVSAEGIEEGRLSFVESVWPSRSEVEPGEKVEYQVRVRSFRGAVETHTLVFPVPKSTPPGRLRVLIGGGSYLAAAERQLLVRRVTGADSLNQIIDIVNRLRRYDAIYGKAVRRLSGAVVQSEVLPALPPSVLTTLRTNRGSGEVVEVAEAPVWETRLPMDSIVVGGAILDLNVR